MTRFRVWAPRAGRVELVLDPGGAGETRRPMAAAAGGWHEADVPEAGPGTDYAFRLDGGPPLPDPRSRHQPRGVHGPSRLVDLDAFAWTDAGFRQAPLASAVLYELHVGTFSPDGTFDGVVRRLDHLVELGVTHLSLMPVAAFAGERGWGYDGVDLYAPHQAYGGPAGLQRLVDACHRRGLAVLLDVVYNHFGPDGCYLDRFGPYFSPRHRTPWGPAINFDGPGSDEVRRFVLDNARTWLAGYHLDGLRLDAVHALVDDSAVHLLEELAAEVEALAAHLGRPLVLIAESDLNDPRLVRSRETGGYGLDAQWSDDFHHALHALLTGERVGYYQDFGGMAPLAKALTRAFVLDGSYSRYRGRRHGRPAGDLPGHRFLGYFQDHDLVGNRSGSERAARLLPPGRLAIAAAVVLTSPFVPMLFQGEEWGATTSFPFFTDHPAELGRQVCDGRRRDLAGMGWDPEAVPDPQAEATFESARLDWDEAATPAGAALADWYRRLIALRRAEPALTDGRLDRVETAYDEAAGWFRMRRGPVTVAFNLATEPRRVPVAPEGAELLLASDPGAALVGAELTLPPASVAVLHG